MATVFLSGELAQTCAADWAQRLDAREREALGGVVLTAFVDTAACILAGRDEAPTRAVAGWARARGSLAEGRAAILFSDERLAADDAALVNAVAGHVLDYDDVGLAGHPSVVLVPALLAQHEAHGTSGFDLVQAYAKGYAVWAELQRRMQVSLHARGWHPSAVFGVVASAAAVASARRLSREQTAHALGIAASSAAGVIANFGSMTKPLQIGQACQRGVQAVDLAQAGIDASPDALDGKAGLLAALAGPGNADLVPGVPAEIELTLLRQRPGIKKYPVCYAAHRAVDGLLDLAARHRFTPGDVSAIDATLSETTAGVLRHHQPASMAEARFSLEFACAAALVRSSLGLRDVTPEVLADAKVQALMPLLRMHTVSTSCPLEPSFAFEDRVVVTLRDGRVLDSGPIRFARGHAQLPLDEAQLRDKLFACVQPHEEQLAQRVLAGLAQALRQ